MPLFALSRSPGPAHDARRGHHTACAFPASAAPRTNRAGFESDGTIVALGYHRTAVDRSELNGHSSSIHFLPRPSHGTDATGLQVARDERFKIEPGFQNLLKPPSYAVERVGWAPMLLTSSIGFRVMLIKPPKLVRLKGSPATGRVVVVGSISNRLYRPSFRTASLFAQRCAQSCLHQRRQYRTAQRCQ